MLKLEEAQKLDANITQDDIDALEQKVRALSNNKFHHPHIKNFNLALMEKTITTPEELIGYKVGDRIEIVGTKYNDGLYTVKAVDNHTITVEQEFISETNTKAFVVKIDYPLDVVNGIKQIIIYNKKMASKIGIKSESVARMSVTYHDINKSDNSEGIPSSYWNFIKKYRKLKW
ncbi:hypothetical protein [Globicatella sp. PHS-GS-PNBC-21-1553]|uniref:hypothetical protein n=1 Tax=Globicatella sp. PHS-GS-PNBC-21-1553 TaxID=2885764 RepID=UPI00298F25AC|nr:hypothetical protein [Globicatella sp. PHS-GS-PNBC-21-1553]WPC08611.1 hypothetical protein LB888_11580 [Globicatella sp. PHS-GS-PNBC-21-1553]